MKKTSELIPAHADRLQTTQQTSSSIANAKPTRPILPDSWIGRLFAKLQARYGWRITQQWPDHESRELAMREWAERLGDMDGDAIALGFDTWDGEWPPSVEEFRSACKGSKTQWQLDSEAYKPFKADLPVKADPTKAGHAIDECRRILGVKTLHEQALLEHDKAAE